MKTRLLLGFAIAALGALIVYGLTTDDTTSCDEQIRQLRLDGDLEAAETAAHECIENHPDNLEARVELSRLLAAQDRTDAAIGWVDRAISDADGTPAEYALWKARLLHREGDHRRARQLLARVDPALVDAEEFDDLSDSIQRAISTCPHVRDHRLDGDLEAARQAARQCLDEYPDDVEIRVELAWILAARGHDDEAWNHLMAAFDAVDEIPVGWALLQARLLHDRGDHDRARRLLDHVPVDSVDPDAYRRLDEALERELSICDTIRERRLTGDFEGARRAAKPCLDQFPDHVQANVELSRLLAMAGRLDEAQKVLETAMETADEPSADHLLWQARLAYWTGDHDRALELLEQIDAGPARTAEIDELREDLRRARRAPPPECAQAERHRVAGDLEAAEDAARHCLEDRPDHLEVRLELSRILALQGEYDAAFQQLEAAERADDAVDPDRLVWRARLMHWTGDHDKALRTLRNLEYPEEDDAEVRRLQDAVEEVPEPTPEACDRIRQHRLEGRLEAAEQYARHCIDEMPGHATARLELSRLLALQDRHTDAMRWLFSAGDHVDDQPPSWELWQARLLYWQEEYLRARRILDDLIEETDLEEADQLKADVQQALNAPPEVCTDIESHRTEGRLDVAEDRARACLADIPADTDARVELSRTLAMQGRHDEALSQFETAAQSADPGPEDLLWKARLLYWMGDYDDAHTVVEDLDTDEIDDERRDRLAATIRDARRQRDWVESRTDLTYTGKATVLSSPDDPSGWQTGHAVDGHPTDQLEARAELDVIRRIWEDRAAADARIGGAATWDFSNRYLLEVGAGATPGANFSPSWDARIQPGAEFGENLEADLRLRRIQFSEAGVNLIRPRLRWSPGPFVLEGRYYHGREATDRNAHSVMSRLMYFPIQTLRVFVGGSVGNMADYMEGRSTSPQRATEGLVGAQYDLTTSLELMADFRYRHEVLEQSTYELFRTTGGVRLRF